MKSHVKICDDQRLEICKNDLCFQQKEWML